MKINEITVDIIEHIAMKLHRERMKAYILYYHGEELKGISEHEVEYNAASKLNINDIYLRYSINANYPCKDQFCMTYRVTDKIIDENENIILIARECEKISAK